MRSIPGGIAMNEAIYQHYRSGIIRGIGNPKCKVSEIIANGIPKYDALLPAPRIIKGRQRRTRSPQKKNLTGAFT